VDHDNAEGIARMQAIAPFFAPNMATVGATIDGKASYEGAGYAYPVLIAMEGSDADLVYNMTRAMVELFDMLIARQDALAKAWTDFVARGVSEADWNGEWEKARREALVAGGFQLVF
jgi:hypothetical protein